MSVSGVDASRDIIAESVSPTPRHSLSRGSQSKDSRELMPEPVTWLKKQGYFGEARQRHVSLSGTSACKPRAQRPDTARIQASPLAQQPESPFDCPAATPLSRIFSRSSRPPSTTLLCHRASGGGSEEFSRPAGPSLNGAVAPPCYVGRPFTAWAPEDTKTEGRMRSCAISHPGDSALHHECGQEGQQQQQQQQQEGRGQRALTGSPVAGLDRSSSSGYRISWPRSSKVRPVQLNKCPSHEIYRSSNQSFQQLDNCANGGGALHAASSADPHSPIRTSQPVSHQERKAAAAARSRTFTNTSAKPGPSFSITARQHASSHFPCTLGMSQQSDVLQALGLKSGRPPLPPQSMTQRTPAQLNVLEAAGTTSPLELQPVRAPKAAAPGHAGSSKKAVTRDSSREEFVSLVQMCKRTDAVMDMGRDASKLLQDITSGKDEVSALPHPAGGPPTLHAHQYVRAHVPTPVAAARSSDSGTNSPLALMQAAKPTAEASGYGAAQLSGADNLPVTPTTKLQSVPRISLQPQLPPVKWWGFLCVGLVGRKSRTSNSTYILNHQFHTAAPGSATSTFG